MGGGWWTRFTINLLILLWGVWMLIPTFMGKSAQERLTEQAHSASSAFDDAEDEDASATQKAPAEWYDRLLPSSRINLGLDLQGGIDMVLTVETEEAVISQVQRDVKSIKDAAVDQGIKVAEIRRTPGEAELLVRLDDSADLDKLHSFMRLKNTSYELVETRNEDGQDWEVYHVTDATRAGIEKRSVEQALETLRNRVNATGVKEPSIALKGGNRINIQLPGMDNVQQAVAALGTTAVLQFMMVVPSEDLDPADLEKGLLDAEQKLDKAVFADDEKLNDWMVRNHKIPTGTRLLWEYKTAKGEKTRARPYVVHDEVMITGDDINDARTAMDPVEGPYVSLDFKPHGAKVFAEVTGENVGRFFAIVLDNEVRSAPRILQKISGGQCRITMGTGDYQQAFKEATVLSLVLRTGALPAPVNVGQVSTVSASLGADLIHAGILASALAGGLVIVFMIWFYRFSGIIANIALTANVLLVMALLAALGATLTLPGIAGTALTMGMAVDCNIVIYERIREELHLGRSPKSALEAGFSHAFRAILDAHVTTFISGVVLYTYGTGPVKGFAVTLMIGIFTTLLTGVFMSRTMMDLYVKKSPQRISI